MFPYNYHTHTARCGHATGTDEEYVKAAIKAGYKVLGFSDHAPYRKYSNPRSHMEWDELPGYIDSVMSLKEKYKDQIEILLGMESEYYPYCHDERKELSEMLDYMLLGQHFSTPTGEEIHFFQKNSEEEILIYGRQVVEAVHTGMFTYLCHPDVFLNRQEAFTDACGQVAHMIGQACQEEGLPVEVNIRGVTKGLKDFPDGKQYWYPNKDFWTILSQYDLKVVVGIDAHDPQNLLDVHFVEEGLKHLEDLHLNYITQPFIHR